MTQKKRHSLLETCISTALGFGVALLTQAVVFPLFGLHTSGGQHVLIALIFTVVSIIRGYFVRRMFNYLHTNGVL
jgi:hypothetical protein